MKRWLSIFILFLYLISGIGITVQTHYCEGELSEIRIAEKAECGSCKTNDSEEDDCCKNEVKTQVLKLDHQSIAFDWLLNFTALVQEFPHFFIPKLQENNLSLGFAYFKPPPDSLRVVLATIGCWRW